MLSQKFKSLTLSRHSANMSFDTPAPVHKKTPPFPVRLKMYSSVSSGLTRLKGAQGCVLFHDIVLDGVLPFLFGKKSDWGLLYVGDVFFYIHLHTIDSSIQRMNLEAALKIEGILPYVNIIRDYANAALASRLRRLAIGPLICKQLLNFSDEFESLSVPVKSEGTIADERREFERMWMEPAYWVKHPRSIEATLDALNIDMMIDAVNLHLRDDGRIFGISVDEFAEARGYQQLVYVWKTHTWPTSENSDFWRNFDNLKHPTQKILREISSVQITARNARGVKLPIPPEEFYFYVFLFDELLRDPGFDLLNFCCRAKQLFCDEGGVKLANLLWCTTTGCFYLPYGFLGHVVCVHCEEERIYGFDRVPGKSPSEIPAFRDSPTSRLCFWGKLIEEHRPQRLGYASLAFFNPQTGMDEICRIVRKDGKYTAVLPESIVALTKLFSSVHVSMPINIVAIAVYR